MGFVSGSKGSKHQLAVALAVQFTTVQHAVMVSLVAMTGHSPAAHLGYKWPPGQRSGPVHPQGPQTGQQRWSSALLPGSRWRAGWLTMNMPMCSVCHGAAGSSTGSGSIKVVTIWLPLWCCVLQRSSEHWMVKVVTPTAPCMW